ncbi:MAG: malate dehydrogenase [bacterium]
MKITLIGAGGVGAETAELVLRENLAKELILVDLNADPLKGKFLDLAHAAAICGSTTKFQYTVDYLGAENSDVYIVTAGLPRTPEMKSRNDLFVANTKVISAICNKIKTLAADPLIIMITNPLDLILRYAIEFCQLNPKKTLGMSGVLDSARFRFYLAKAAQVPVSEVTGLVIGPHGEAMVPLVSLAKISGKPLSASLTPDQIAQVITETVQAGANITNLQGRSAIHAPAAALVKMLQIIQANSEEIISASVQLSGEYGIKDVCLEVPLQINQDGIAAIIELKIVEEELAALRESAKILQEAYQQGIN